MMIRVLAASVFAAAAAGCATMAEPADTSNTTRETAPDGTEYTVVDRTGEGSRCPADAYQVLVGQQGSEIDTASLPAPHRVYGVGDPVTMDYRADRLNIVVGADGMVAEVKCG